MTTITATVADRVRERTSTTGTGDITLGGAVTGFQSFAQAFGISVTTFYCILAGNGIDWEVGQNTFNSGANTITRTASGVLASSNSGNLINLTGSSVVFCDGPAAFMNPLTQIGIPALYLAATNLFGGI